VSIRLIRLIRVPKTQKIKNKKMLLYLADLFTRLAAHSEKLDNIALLTNQHWVSIDEIAQQKVVYIFRTNNELLISTNGSVQEARWEYLGNNSLLVRTKDSSLLLKHGFFDDSILALKRDSTDDFNIFVNENKHSGELNTAEKVARFLENRYFDTKTKAQIESGTGRSVNTRPVVVKTVEELEKERLAKAEQERIRQMERKNADKVLRTVILVLIFLCTIILIIGVSSNH
jgi:hypothetical protein